MKNKIKIPSLLIVALLLACFFSTGCVSANKAVEKELDPYKVTIVPIEKCYQFAAPNQPDVCENNQNTTIVLEYRGGDDECEVTVKSMEGNQTCAEVKENGDRKEPLKDILISVQFINLKSETSQEEQQNTLPHTDLTGTIVAGSKCSEMWFRFTDKRGCNRRCVKIGGQWICW